MALLTTAKTLRGRELVAHSHGLAWSLSHKSCVHLNESVRRRLLTVRLSRSVSPSVCGTLGRRNILQLWQRNDSNFLQQVPSQHYPAHLKAKRCAVLIVRWQACLVFMLSLPDMQLLTDHKTPVLVSVCCGQVWEQLGYTLLPVEHNTGIEQTLVIL